MFLKSVKERALNLDKGVEVNDARLVYPNNCCVLEVPHLHGSQLLAAVMDRWLSFSRHGSNRLPWNYPHVKMWILILRITFMRPSELLELKRKDFVPSLLPLLP